MRTIITALGLVGLLLGAALARPLDAPSPAEVFQARGVKEGPQGRAQTPLPTTIDQVLHDRGNIATTIDNWGLIGGYWNRLPSCEWPRNSGHNYLAESMYWIGAVNAAGDTLLANTSEDFQGIPMPLDGSDRYKIYLSTDTSRYYAYDETDTVGLGLGHPARGWRVYDPVQDAYTYNENYSSLSSSFRPGGPASIQDSYYRFNDAALGTPLMGFEIAQKGMQWNYCYNEDFIFFQLDITNTSSMNYTDVAFGLYFDFDIGGLDGLGENGRLRDQLVYDSIAGWAYMYDVVGIDPGWGPGSPTGIMGSQVFASPDDLGVTAIRTDDWAFLPTTDRGRYRMINASQYDEPLPPTDQFYLQCVSGFDLPAGQTVSIVYAIIAGIDSMDFMENLGAAQQVFDNNYVGAEPPPTPTLTARAGDGKAYLMWNDTAEVGFDPASGVNDFAGYKLYRSENRGKTWGTINQSTGGNTCLSVDYIPVARYNAVSPGDLMPHAFIDTGLSNGVEYWYCLAAFDTGDDTADPPLAPLQSGFGSAGEVANVIAVRPGPDPAGYISAGATVEHLYSGTEEPSDGVVVPELFDRSAAMASQYEVTFEEFYDTTYWNLLNQATGDTLLARQTYPPSDPAYVSITEGFRILVQNGEKSPRGAFQSAFSGADTTFAPGPFYGPGLTAVTGDATLEFGDVHFRSTYELRCTSDSTRASAVVDWFHGSTTVYWLPFEVWNVSSNERVSASVWDFAGNGVFDNYDLMLIVNYPYDSLAPVDDFAYPHYCSWLFGFDDETYAPAVGDVMTVQGAPLNGPDDRFVFDLDGISSSLAGKELKDIRVVPNPYLVAYSSKVETSEGQSILEFQNVPDRCTIRIYTLAGDMVDIIEHSGSGTARWDLLSKGNQLVASGIYLYHVESPYGDHLGRFAVIK